MRLQTELKTLFRFLFDASEPWTYWTKRTEQATFLMRKLIRKTISQNAVMMIGKEAELNVLLDLLRQESSEEGLIQSLNSVIELLNDITKCYEESFDAEKSVIEQLYALGETQHNLLCIEVLKFQKKNPQDEFKAYHDMEPEPEEKSIYMMVEEPGASCRQDLFMLWKVVLFFRFWEGIKFAVENAKQEIEETIEEWVNFLQGRALKRLEMRMMLHSPRYDRILTEILVVRQAELKFQSDRLDMHIQVNQLSSY
ncbi:hypothetical protein C0J52_12599 [Blattella germanica]|nr:hypothetical protein C0J52_12599 [Blattella germanica]